MSSIQSNITQYILAGIFIVATVTGIIIDEFTHQQFNTQFNNTLESKAWSLATLIDQENGLVEFDFADEMMPEFEPSENSEYFELWQGNGKILERSHSLNDSDLPFVKINQGESVFLDFDLPDGQPARLIAIHFTPQVDLEEEDSVLQMTVQSANHLDSELALQTVTLVLARKRDKLNDDLVLNRIVIVLSLMSMLIVSYLIIRFAVKKGLSPLTTLSDEVKLIDDHSLDTELGQHNMASELTLITMQLNHLLSRLNAAFLREKRFSSNVSHELRAPIAELMTLSEVGKSCIDNPEMILQFFQDTQDIAQNMNLLVETLLTLAHSEPGRVNTNMTVFNLHECIQKSINRIRLNNKDCADIDWQCATDNLPQIFSDWDKLEQILNNLITNACKYGQRGSSIIIRTKMQGQQLSCSISNLTADLEKADLEHLTEYFWRKDEARSGGKNSGLGLTLVAILCDVLKISVSFELDVNQRFTVTLSNFPNRLELNNK